jgi:hypothetical protein
MERNHMEDTGIYWGTVLRCIANKRGGKVRNGFICLRIGFNRGICEQGNENFGCIKGGEFLNKLIYFYIQKYSTSMEIFLLL